jgi:hypothetical protein
VALSARVSLLSLYFIDLRPCVGVLHINVTFFLSQFCNDNITRLVLSLSLSPFPCPQILVTSGCHNLPSLRQLLICCLFLKVIFSAPSQPGRTSTSIYLTSAALLSLVAPLRPSTQPIVSFIHSKPQSQFKRHFSSQTTSTSSHKSY